MIEQIRILLIAAEFASAMNAMDSSVDFLKSSDDDIQDYSAASNSLIPMDSTNGTYSTFPANQTSKKESVTIYYEANKSDGSSSVTTTNNANKNASSVVSGHKSNRNVIDISANDSVSVSFTNDEMMRVLNDYPMEVLRNNSTENESDSVQSVQSSSQSNSQDQKDLFISFDDMMNTY